MYTVMYAETYFIIMDFGEKFAMLVKDIIMLAFGNRAQCWTMQTSDPMSLVKKLNERKLDFVFV